MNFKLLNKLFLLLALTISFSYANKSILLYKVPNKEHNITAQTLADGLTMKGYVVSKNQDMNGPYVKQFKKSGFDIYNLISIYQPEFAQKMVLKHKNAGIFLPFSVAVYQRKKEDTLYIALLSAKTQQEILETKDKLFEELEALNKKTILSILPTATEAPLNYESAPHKEKLFTAYNIESEDEDALEEYDEMMMTMEGSMKMNGFVVANYIDYNKELKENNVTEYQFYHSYSLCKLKVIYELSKKHPEAGAFAPCSMSIFHKKDSNTTNIVSLNINALISTLALKDKELIKMLSKTQGEMQDILKDATE